MPNTQGVQSDYSLLLRSYLLTIGLPTDHLNMCRELSRRTGLEFGFCNHLLSVRNEMRVEELETVCKSLGISIRHLFKHWEPENTVTPWTARNPYSGMPMDFFLGNLYIDASHIDVLCWINGVNFESQIRTTDCIVFINTPIVTFKVGHIYILFDGEDYTIGRCTKINNLYSEFLDNDGATFTISVKKLKDVKTLKSVMHGFAIVAVFSTYFGPP